MYVTSPVAHNESEIVFTPDMLTVNEACLNDTCQTHTIKAGNGLFFEGDDADYIYEVVSGVVRSSKMLMDGRRQVLNFGYPGDMIGLSHNEAYPCDCDAVSDVKVRIIRKNAYRKDIETDPALCANLLRMAAAEVNNMQEHFIMLGRKSAMEKIGSFLVAIMDRQSEKKDCKRCFNLPMSRADIADFLGLTIETVSRNLTKLRKQGVIDLPMPQQVCVKKPEALRALAENDI